MTKKTQAKPRPKGMSQIAAFKKTARALETDESEEAFDKALGKIGRVKPTPKTTPQKKLPQSTR